jgi:hypothetical protein
MGLIREAITEVKQAGKLSSRPTSANAISLEQGIHQASSPDLVLACHLIGESLQELQTAITQIRTRGGVLPAARTAAGGIVDGNEAWTSDAGKALIHDGRWPAVDLVTAAEQKYEQVGPPIHTLRRQSHSSAAAAAGFLNAPDSALPIVWQRPA